MEDSSRKLRMKMHYILKSKIASYILLTFSVSYGYVFVYYIFGGRLSGVEGLLFAVSYMFIPSVCSFILQRFIYKEPLKELGLSFPIKKSWMWFLIAWILPVAIASVTIFSSLLIPGVHFSQGMEGLFEKYRSLLTPEQLSQMHNSLNTMPIHPFFLGIILALFAGASINAIAAFGEELGWRGFLFNQVEKRGIWKASAFTGLIWGLWHAPFIIQGHNYPEHPFLGVFMMVVFTILLSPVMHLIRLKTKSVFSAAIFHGTINASVGLPVMLVNGGNDLTVGVFGIGGFIVLVLINTGVYLYLK
jgi:membrane protease YdiL (CAAX protease family)